MSERPSGSDTAPGGGSPFARHSQCDHAPIRLYLRLPGSTSTVDFFNWLANLDALAAEGDIRQLRAHLWGMGNLIDWAAQGRNTEPVIRQAAALLDARAEAELRQILEGGEQ